MPIAYDDTLVMERLIGLDDGLRFDPDLAPSQIAVNNSVNEVAVEFKIEPSESVI